MVTQERRLPEILEGAKYHSKHEPEGLGLDKVMMENVFGVMKSEFFYPNTFKDMELFKRELWGRMEDYNKKWIKRRLKE